MGGFLVLVASLIVLMLTIFLPQVDDLSAYNERSSLEAASANMVAFHQAAVDFVSLPENRNPVGGSWSFTYASQAVVRCPGSYAGGTYDSNGIATSPNCTAGLATEFKLPSYFAPIYNWSSYYVSDGAGGNDDILVTYVQDSSDDIAGYNSAEVAAILRNYALATKSGWYWGVTETSGSPLTLANDSESVTLPAGFSATGVVAIATIIP